jgi:hypothetical protein
MVGTLLPFSVAQSILHLGGYDPVYVIMGQ